MNTNEHERKLNQLSLALNVVLAVACAVLVFRRAVAPEPSTSIAPAPVEPAARAGGRHDAVARENSGRTASRDWIDTLRGEGVPEKMIVRLVLADFEDRWQSRQTAAQQAYNRGELDSDGLAAIAREHDVEQENDLRARLGDEAFRRWDQDRLFEPFHFIDVTLTPGETNSLYEFAVNLRQRLRNLDKARQENEIDQAALNSEQAKAQSEFDHQLRALLGDERYAALSGENPAVGELRRHLRGLSVDDDQFAMLLRAQEQWEAARAQLEQQQVETGDTNLLPQISALNEKRDQTFVSLLGTNGFAQFQKQQDSRYLEMQKNADRWGLDRSSIDAIYEVIQTYERAAAEYDRTVREIESQAIRIDRDALNQNLRDYARQLAQNLRARLGDARYDTLSRNQVLPFETP